MQTERSDIGAPPPCPVEWRVTSHANGKKRTTRVTAQLWMDARREGAAKLGVTPELCSCVRLDEQKLKSKGLA